MKQAEISELWEEFQLELKVFVARKVGSQTDADDILQDVFLKVYRNQEKILAASNVRQYLYAMVRNAVNDYFRERKQRRVNQEIPEVLSEEESSILNETIAECCIRPFLKQLSPKYREALQITEFEEVSQKELAARLGMSYSGAKSRVQRGKEKLKQMILSCCALESDAYGNILGRRKQDCDCSLLNE